MTTTREQILDFMRGRQAPASAAEISKHIEASQQAVYVQLSNLFAAGDLVRTSPGVYTLPELAGQADAAPAADPAPKPPRKAKRRFTPPPEPTTVAVTIEAPSEHAGGGSEAEPLQWALWHDGDLMLRKGEATVVLTAAEVADLTRRLARLQEVVA
jgi:hypothetical protein